VPLLLFAAGAQRLPLITMGLLFYLNPALQMAWGVLVGHEPMPVGRWIGFALIWVALAVMTVGSLRRKSTGEDGDVGDVSNQPSPDRHHGDDLDVSS
jgi:chloramphenicol-sensitive protein RarD